jgi:hypothetical protein
VNVSDNRVGAIGMTRPNDPIGNCGSSRCYGVVTHRQLEVLFLVSQLPMGYIDARREVLVGDYSHVLTARQAFEAFEAMLGLVPPGSLSDKGLACFNAFRRRDGYAAFYQSP